MNKIRFFKNKKIIGTMFLSVLFLINACSDVSEKGALLPEPKIVKDDWKAPLQEAAILRSLEKVDFVIDILNESPSDRENRLKNKKFSKRDIAQYFLLDSPIIKKSNDLYHPVRFMHRTHAGIVEKCSHSSHEAKRKDCTVCHHHRPADMKKGEIMRCSACHQKAFDPKVSGRVGLKAAYHLRCMGCHQEIKKGPVGCTGCHTKNVPDHSKLVKLTGHESPTEVTKECLRCHEEQGKDMIKTSHWLWKGPSPYTEGHEKRIDSGKATNVINNFCIHIGSNWPRCTSCHVGYGWKDDKFDFTDMTKIDCLVCHDTTGHYKKAPPGAGMPKKNVNLKFVAERVGKASRKTCGTCHFSGGGGDGVKHGDMNQNLLKPDKNCDVHMGGYNFACQECHKTKKHKIYGRSFSIPAAEGTKTCEDCHTDKPHNSDGYLDDHLNRHTKTVACNTCHTPIYSKCASTKVYWDWSSAGDKKRKPKKDKYGKKDYIWKKGNFKWARGTKPEYEWYNGKIKRHYLGDKANMKDLTSITKPVGDIMDHTAKIYPFKVMRGIQPADAVTEMLLVPHLFGKGGYWKTLDWEKSFEDGMKSVGLKYSGKHKWVKTEMYWGIEHEVTPKEMALSCVQCHSSLRAGNACGRCHHDSRSQKFNKLAWKGTSEKYKLFKNPEGKATIGQTNYINFRKLGYKGDPIIYGGRFKKLPIGK